MAYINTAPAASLDDTYNALYKYVKQYITNGNLKSRFDVFEREEVKQGYGIETNVILAAKNLRKKQTDGSVPDKAAEHNKYKAKVFTLISTEKYPAQYAVTIDEDRLAQITGNDAKIQEYAQELTESLYQGWVDEKNTAVMEGISLLINKANPINVTLSPDNEEAYALSILANLKTVIADFYEGVTGDSFANTQIGEDRIAAESIVIVMSNAMAATLDTYGFSKVFDADYLKTKNVSRIESSRVPDGKILITDARNIILHKRNESVVQIINSDNSKNIFYNVNYFIDTAFDDSGDYEEIAFPAKVILTTEAVGVNEQSLNEEQPAAKTTKK